MIYGANGYAGRLIVMGLLRGFRPVLAGRNAREIGMLASIMLLILGCLLVAEIL